MPIIGEIRQFAFQQTTEASQHGWLPCDGAAYDTSDYPRLYMRIGAHWGTPAPNQVFQVPDLRGFFIRNWAPDPAVPVPQVGDNIRSGDPGPRQTHYANGAAAGVGSYQADAVGPHDHPAHLYQSLFQGGQTDVGQHVGNVQTTISTGRNAGVESRPKNALLLAMIYAGRRGDQSPRFFDPDF